MSSIFGYKNRVPSNKQHLGLFLLHLAANTFIHPSFNLLYTSPTQKEFIYFVLFCFVLIGSHL